MALLTREGRQLTDFRYYIPQQVADNLISVSDGKETFFLDTQGQPAHGVPSVAGFGTLRWEGSLLKADVDDRVRYLDRNFQIVWQSDNTMPLAGGLRVIERKHRANRATLIFSPEFAGLADSQAQESLNRRLHAEFLGGELGPPRERVEEPSATTDFGFSVRQMKGLVIIYETGYWYGWGAAHGMSSRTYYHVDAKTGALYTLADLFRKESAFTDRLQAIIHQQILANQDKGVNQNPEVKLAQAFYLSADALTIYYRPYEISSYSRGFVEFTIPWSEISDLIDTNGPFWRSFH
ncbi:MAG TPA: RsiV family protein [Symbiobacteriaceae bacterium]|nr:RsiV family protein [Symbiobacteriaceae bacterium]